MFLRHHSGSPYDHVIRYVRGKPVQEGLGLSFVYMPFTTTVVSVPTQSVDARFRFNGWTSDLQRVRAEVEVVYRITSPRRAAAHLGFRVKGRGSERERDHLTVLRRRVLGIARSIFADEMSRMPLRRAVGASSELGRSVKIRMGHSRLLKDMGISVLVVSVRGVECSSEAAEAIEAENLRPSLLASQSADDGYSLTGHSALPLSDRSVGVSAKTSSIECADSCPFRHLCEDYMKVIRGGRAWCTLFHEFST